MTLVITHFPSPYQVELFDEIERQRPGTLKVLYLFRTLSSRSWNPSAAAHAHEYLHPSTVTPDIENEVRQAAFVVFNYYNDARVSHLIRVRAATGRPWCFWGERPGYRYPWLARIARLGRLAALHAGDQPIWGIGSWAVDEYRREFGNARSYVNLPYYSNLERFQARQPAFSDREFTFLFSGVLSHRKGVDVLARAFRRLAADDGRVRLKIMGQGEWRARLERVLGPHARVEWVGFRDWAHLPAEYATAHALCVPSRHDGWGLVVPEGLASGLPVIATARTGAALDLVRTGYNGWVVAAGDEDALHDAMRQAASLDAESWARMSANARASVGGHSLAEGARRFSHAVAAGLAQSDARRSVSGGR